LSDSRPSNFSTLGERRNRLAAVLPVLPPLPPPTRAFFVLGVDVDHRHLDFLMPRDSGKCPGITTGATRSGKGSVPSLVKGQSTRQLTFRAERRSVGIHPAGTSGVPDGGGGHEMSAPATCKINRGSVGQRGSRQSCPLYRHRHLRHRSPSPRFLQLP